MKNKSDILTEPPRVTQGLIERANSIHFSRSREPAVGWKRGLGGVYLALILRRATTANVFFTPSALPIRWNRRLWVLK
jgi:hypothetical protein